MPELEDVAPRRTHFGFKANPMDKLFISHGGLSSLCFDRNAFFDDAFDVDGFLSSHTQRGIPLEVLKDDLATYRKIVQSALVQLVDREYADFVHLSSSLVGVDKGIEKLRNPVENHLGHVKQCLSVLDGHISALDSMIARRAEIDQQKDGLERLISAMECMETLVGVERKLQESSTKQARLPLLYRISDLLARLYSDGEKISHTAWYLRMKPQITVIDTTFIKVLGEELLSAVHSGDASTIRRYFLMYQHLNRVANAYQVVADGAVRPALAAVCQDSRLKKSPLEVLLNDIFTIVEERFYSLAYVTRADFVLESLWTSLAALLTVEIQAHLAPDQADLFRQNYAAAKNFMVKFANLFAAAGRRNFATEFWTHPATSSFLDKWSFPVYYQVRFMEIASPVEDAMGKGLSRGVESDSHRDGFKLDVSRVTWRAIVTCWDARVCLPELVHRFWKLSLLFISRYKSWLETLGDISVAYLSDIIADVVRFRRLISDLPGKYVQPVFATEETSFAAVHQILSESLDESIAELRRLEERFVCQLAAQTALELERMMKTVQDTPRLYRRTNRDAPTAAAPYVDLAFEQLQKTLERDAGLTEDQLKTAYSTALNAILSQYAALILDLLDSARRMEDSLKKLRKTRFAADSATGLTDDDKIRLQLSLDVRRIQHWIEKLGFGPAHCPAFAAATERVLSEKPEQE